MSNLQEKKEDYILSLDNSGQLTKMDIIEQNLNAIDFGYELCKREYEEKLRWIPVEDPPKKAELIILEYSGCSNSKKYVIYDFDPEYFEGVFHVNGVAERWRSFL